MPNAIYSGKSKSKQVSKRPTLGPKDAGERLIANTPASKKLAAEKLLQGTKGVAMKATAGAKLRAGAQLLTQAMSSYAAQVSSNTGASGGRLPSDFQEAYSSIIHAVPKSKRLPLLQQMKQSIEAVAKAELNVSLRELAANDEDSVSTVDFMSSLERQEKEQRAKDLTTEKLLPGAEMRARLAVTPQALSAALKAKRMFVLQGPSGEYAYPAFFADPTLDRPVLAKVCKALGDLPGASKWDFFTSPRHSLGGQSPLDALAKGRVGAVMDAANAFRNE